MALIVPRPKAPTGEVKFETLVDLLAPQGEERRPRRVLPAEWAPQSGVQLTWPHAETDWAYMLDEVTETYVHMAYEIARREPLLIVTPHPADVRSLLEKRLPAMAMGNVHFFECPTNDTWARDHGFITVLGTDGPELLDFRFNGWGGKFEATLDNAINARLVAERKAGAQPSAGSDRLCSATGCRIEGRYVNCLDFELEGGAIESDGMGTILTTAECLLNANRRHEGDAVPAVDKAQVEILLRERLGAERILWLDHGYLAGDDTDSHIDTLARLCPGNVIVYVKCSDPADEHYAALRAMEEQLETFRTADGEPYTLIPVPLPEACYENDDDNDALRYDDDNDNDALQPVLSLSRSALGTLCPAKKDYDDSAPQNKESGARKGERLPATYANFLIMNDAVLLPVYAQPERDAEAIRQMQKAFPHHEIVPIDCRSLIRQHGSLHCCTMQFPRGVVTEG